MAGGILGAAGGLLGNTAGGGAPGAGTDPVLAGAEQQFTQAQDSLLIQNMQFGIQQQQDNLVFQQFQQKQQTALSQENQLSALSDKATQLKDTQINTDIQNIGH